MRREFIFRTQLPGNDKTFTPKALERRLNTGDYKVKLQEGLTINLEERPHMRILGRLVRKDNAPGNPVAAHALSNAEMYAVDGKDELRSVGPPSKNTRQTQKTSYILQIR